MITCITKSETERILLIVVIEAAKVCELDDPSLILDKEKRTYDIKVRRGLWLTCYLLDKLEWPLELIVRAVKVSCNNHAGFCCANAEKTFSKRELKNLLKRTTTKINRR